MERVVDERSQWTARATGWGPGHKFVRRQMTCVPQTNTFASNFLLGLTLASSPQDKFTSSLTHAGKDEAPPPPSSCGSNQPLRYASAANEVASKRVGVRGQISAWRHRDGFVPPPIILPTKLQICHFLHLFFFEGRTLLALPDPAVDGFTAQSPQEITSQSC